MSMSRKAAWFVAAVAALCLCAGLLAADVKQPAVQKGVAAAKAAMQPQMSEKEMMEAYEKAATLNEHHKNMAKMVGNWNVNVKSWSAPGAPPTESKGTAKFTSLLDGRYIQLDVKSEMMGKPFTGMGLFAYDKGRKKHTATWIDSMGTGFWTSSGTCEKSCSVIKGTGEFWDPLTGKKMSSREVTRWDGDNKMIHEMYGPSMDGKAKDFKMMEITYTRQ